MNSSSSSSEDELDVLQPAQPSGATASSSTASAAALGGQDAPRLSWSGGGRSDPIALDDDDDDSDSGGGAAAEEQEELSLRDRLNKKLSSTGTVKAAPATATAPAPSKPVSHTSDRAGLDNDSDSSSSSSSCGESSLQAKLNAIHREKAKKRSLQRDDSLLSASSDEDEDDDDDDNLFTTTITSKRQKVTQPAAASQKKPPPAAAAAATKKKSSASSLAAAEAKRRQQELKRQERQRAQEVKLQEKQMAKIKKQRDRVAKQAAQLAAKTNKQRVREQAAQRTGKHAKKEIAVLMETALYRHVDFTLEEDFREAEYTLKEYRSALGCKAVQWIRKDMMAGGAADALQQLAAKGGDNRDGYVHLPVLAVVFEAPAVFIQLLARHEHGEDDDYPLLAQWLRGVEAGWQSAWGYPSTVRPRVILFLYQVSEELNRMWVRYNKSSRQSSEMPPSAEELQDALAWMLIQFQVESIQCPHSDCLSHELVKMTRMLSEQPYQQRATDLDCIHKIKSHVDKDTATDFEIAKDVWMRQLQQVPSISFNKARALTRYYPTARSLWLAYQNDTLTLLEKRLLVADLFGQQRREVKLSEQLYRLLTSEDPGELLC